MQPPFAPYLSVLAGLAAEPLYLVGGSVRDLLLGIGNIKDLDLAMAAGSETLAQAFADRIGGSFFFLDEDRKITRVVKRGPDGDLQFDFTNFEGPDLRADLARRDFAMNAMAVELCGFLSAGKLDGLVDPFDGKGDIEKRVVRVFDAAVLDADPLRLLRAVRFAATLGFSIDAPTQEAVRARADLAVGPAPERIRDELFQVLAVPGAGRYVEALESLGLLRTLLPELSALKDFAPGRHHCYDILTHSLKTTEYVDAVLDDLVSLAPDHAGHVRDLLAGELEPLVTRGAALRFACLLHDVAKAETYSRDDDGDIHFFGHDTVGSERALAVCRRFRLSGNTGSVVSRLVRHHMRPLNLSAPGGPTRRALYRYCRDLKDAVPESVVLSLADARATSEAMPEGFTDTSRTAAVILDYYFGKYLKTEAQPFITGRDLIARGMRPGPGFREILDDIREQQAGGTLRNRAEALAYLDRRERAR